MIEEIEKRIDYRFKNREYLVAALTHKSYNEGMKEKKADNERLEFLGDSVIGLAITDYLFRKLRDRGEGELAKIKAHLVSSNFLFQIAKKIDLGRFLLLGKGEEKSNGRENRNILSAAFEALIGAVYVDSTLKNAAQIVLHFFIDTIEPLAQQKSRINDYKSELQEMIQKHRSILPVYRILGESGKPPDMTFRVGVYLDEIEIGQGGGRNRREAEQKAALSALQNIGNFIHFEKLSEVFFLKNAREGDDPEPAGKIAKK